MEPALLTSIPPLERLPPELIHVILINLSSLTSLCCAILSSRVLLQSFTADRPVIATRVLFNELDACDVRPEAIAALLASELFNLTRPSAQEFFKTHLKYRNAEYGILLTLDQVTYISRLHLAISRLAEDFTRATLQHLVATNKDNRTSEPQPLEPSALERCRTIRILYILEVFFSVFRRPSMPDAELGQSMNDFLLIFAHWEIEQIACMQEFLFFQISPSFNEMAAHDVCWGNYEVGPARWFGQPRLQSVYFKGLVGLESLAKAKTYDQLYELFDHGSIPKARSRNLDLALRELIYEEGGKEQSLVSNYANARDYALKIKRAYFEDPDSGPFSIWKWAHESAPLTQSVYHRRQSKLRKWGYVMWDRARLDQLATCYDKWRPLDAGSFSLSPPDCPAREVDKSWEFSWRERSRIYNEQGRGYWIASDESKIVWARDKDSPEKDGLAKKIMAKSRNIPTSLDEARRVILALKRP